KVAAAGREDRGPEPLPEALRGDLLGATVEEAPDSGHAIDETVVGGGVEAPEKRRGEIQRVAHDRLARWIERAQCLFDRAGRALVPHARADVQDEDPPRRRNGARIRRTGSDLPGRHWVRAGRGAPPHLPSR